MPGRLDPRLSFASVFCMFCWVTTDHWLWAGDLPRIAYFDNHYGKPLGTLDKQHCIALKDLPRATKIPFQSQESEAPASKL